MCTAYPACLNAVNSGLQLAPLSLPPLCNRFPTDVRDALMTKIEIQDSIEVRVNTATFLESESPPAAKLRSTQRTRLPNRPTTVAHTLPPVPGTIRSPGGDFPISGRVNIVRLAEPVLGTFVGDHQQRFRMNLNG